MRMKEGSEKIRIHARGCYLTALVFILTVSAFTIVPDSQVKAGTAVQGIIFLDTNWTEADSPIWVEGSIWLPKWVNLTIHPGVEVRFNGNYTIWVDGNFSSIGTPTKRISFTSNSTAPGHQDWFKIRTNATSRFEIENTDFSNAFSAIELMGRTGDLFANNTFSDSFIGVVSLSTDSVEVVNNTFQDTYHGLKLTGNNNTVRNSTFIGGRVGVDISCDEIVVDCSDNVIGHNDFMNMEGGVNLRSDHPGTDISRNSIHNNTFEDVDAPVAISNLRAASEDSIVANNVMADGAYGVFLRNSDSNTVAGNMIINFREGIGLYGSENATVARNSISRGIDGIVVRDTAVGNRIVFNNIVSFQSCGIALVQGTSGNLVYHNNLLDSGYNGCDAGTGNVWDNGYPSGGNFWSDYTGPDLFNGPNQDIPGSDAIGDLPHDTRGNGRDHYPLLSMPSGNIPITKLDIELTGTNFEDVTIYWNLTWPNGNISQDITRFDLYRSEMYDGDRIGYQLLANVSNDTFEYTDLMAGEGNSSNFFYYVCSVNLTNVSLCSFDQVGKFTRPLELGWNLISIPLTQKHWGTAEVLKTTAFDRVLGYDSLNRENMWKEYNLNKPYRDLDKLEITKGYWIHVTQDCNLTVVGKVPLETRIAHSVGWNLLGYPSFTNRTIQSALEEKYWESAEGFENSTSPYHLEKLSGIDLMIAGNGYWVFFSTSGVWTIRN